MNSFAQFLIVIAFVTFLYQLQYLRAMYSSTVSSKYVLEIKTRKWGNLNYEVVRYVFSNHIIRNIFVYFVNWNNKYFSSGGSQSKLVVLRADALLTIAYPLRGNESLPKCKFDNAQSA
jgi:hypothetical protein